MISGGVQDLPEPHRQLLGVPQLALPDDCDVPSCVDERSLFASIALPVCRNLRLPVLEARLRKLSDAAAMAVPVASMHEHRKAPTREYDVRSAWQVLAMQSEPITHPVQQGTHLYFGLCVLALHLLHQVTTAIRGETVDGLVCLTN